MDERLVPGMADAEPHAPVVVADMGGDRAQAVVAGIAASSLQLELGRRQVDLVVKDVDVSFVDLEVAMGLADGLAAVVHVGLRL